MHLTHPTHHLAHHATPRQAAAYDALLSGQAGASSEEAVFLRAVAADAARWRLRRRFSGAAAAAEVYGKATALEALVSELQGGCTAQWQLSSSGTSVNALTQY
jgi:hypothetical protein